ncbi:hypothetical protein H6F89_08435 [Cyanobacteria bacterium FACHB-63]|nr:hypothetical protein [Cyanobacteria bacterium FACHB-63]
MATSSATDIDQVISALKGGLTSVPADTAVQVIDGFEQQVRGLGATEIANNLVKLKSLLTSGGGSQQEIGQTLSQLGSQTSAAASGADSELTGKLQELGQLLSNAGQSLA